MCFRAVAGRQSIRALKLMLHHFPSVNGLNWTVCFPDVTGNRHQGLRGSSTNPRHAFQPVSSSCHNHRWRYAPLGQIVFKEYNLSETLYLTASPAFLHLLSSSMWRIKGFTAHAAVRHLVHLSKKPSMFLLSKQLHFLSLDVTRDLSHQS